MTRSLSALLSQALVAFTVELDNEFELRMAASGYSGARLSLVVWLNLMRVLAERDATVHELAATALTTHDSMRAQLGCLERWGCVVLDSTEGSVGRDGWGSGRGIRADWVVRPTEKGSAAIQIWATLVATIERRWDARFGAEQIARVRASLGRNVNNLGVELPGGLPSRWLPDNRFEFPTRTSSDTSSLTLPTLLSRALLAFAIEFDRESDASIALSANTIRVLGDGPIRAADVALLTGCSPETTAVGWRLKPYVIVEPNATNRRGNTIRLSTRGRNAKLTYERLCRDIEARWRTTFGAGHVETLRNSLLELFRVGDDGRQVIAHGLVPPGTVRAGDVSPALGRKDIGTAARQRARDLVAQTAAFVNDPANALPHYPLWDMNRGFGPSRDDTEPGARRDRRIKRD